MTLEKENELKQAFLYCPSLSQKVRVRDKSELDALAGELKYHRSCWVTYVVHLIKLDEIWIWLRFHLMRFELLFQEFLFNFDTRFTNVISNSREFHVDFIDVYFIIILKENKEILAFTWGQLLKSYQKMLYHKPTISYLFIVLIIISTSH